MVPTLVGLPVVVIPAVVALGVLEGLPVGVVLAVVVACEVVGLTVVDVVVVVNLTLTQACICSLILKSSVLSVGSCGTIFNFVTSIGFLKVMGRVASYSGSVPAGSHFSSDGLSPVGVVGVSL